MKERWKPVVGYEKEYAVSDQGRVASLPRLVNKETPPFVIERKGKLLRQTRSRDGYLNVILYKDGTRKSFQVHRLVALAFIPNPEDKEEVNHKDTRKQNNRVMNLEWMTRSENVKHAYDSRS